MQIKPSAVLRQNYNEISDLCKSINEPIYITKNGEGDLVVTSIETFTRREKMLDLRERLISIEEARLMGQTGCSLEEFKTLIGNVLDGE